MTGENIAILPTRPTVDATWERYQSLCRQLQQNEALRFDAAFQAELAEAEADWMRTYQRWAKRA